MNTTTHIATPEEVMAFLDGELSEDERRIISAHLAECDECSALAGELRVLSHDLARWELQDLPQRIEREVLRAAKGETDGRPTRGFGSLQHSWVLRGAGALAAIVLLSVGWMQHSTTRTEKLAPYFGEAGRITDLQASHHAPLPQPAPPSSVNDADSMAMAERIESLPVGKNATPLAQMAPGVANGVRASTPPAPDLPPMIARSVSLTILVRDVSLARPAVDALLAQFHGYPASMTVNTPENDARSVEASLRVPAAELASALKQLRTLGYVQNETQTGEEVTQKHADLAQRIKTAREAEDQLRDILAHRAGKIEEVLQVEEEAARVRSEIESMQAEQQTLEHRVTFATIDLQIREEYKAPLRAPQSSLGTEVHNAFVSGYRHVSGAVTTVFLSAIEFGPVILFWVVILAVPAWFIRRRYQRALDRA
jgi:hypothetical protein